VDALASARWCKQQRREIRVGETSQQLCQEYLQSAQETLQVLEQIGKTSNMWLATTKYYCEYFAFTAVLMKLGIRSEIHECTIALCSMLESEGIIRAGTSTTLEEDKELRIDNQYYLKNKDVAADHDDLLDFVLEMKRVCETLTSEQTTSVRNLVSHL